MTRRTFSALSVVVVIAGSVVAGSAPASSGLPSKATPVQVTSGVVTTGIDASVTPLGAISGRITSVKSGEPVGGADVLALGEHAQYFGEAYTRGGSDGGRYLIPGLIPGSSYRICVSAESAHGGGSPTGYLSRCYKSDAWNGRGAPPTEADPVAVAAGVKTRIDIALPSAAAIAGKVTNRDGTAFVNVPVVAKNLGTGQRFHGYTDRTGHYLLKGLTPSPNGYAVCFFGPAGPPSRTGYLDECWQNQAWAGRRIPSDARSVRVHRARKHTGISPVLDAAGAIAGRLTDAVTGDSIPKAFVLVFDAAGRVVSNAITDRSGHYVANGLRGSRHNYVCVFGRPISRTTRYKNKCYTHVHWSGRKLPSSGLTAVAATPGQIHPGIDFALGKKTVNPPKPPKPPKHPKYGSISGVITSGVDGTTPLHAPEDVLLFGPNGHAQIEVSTNASGAYKVGGLPPNTTGYMVCADADTVTSPTPPTGGWAPTCYHHAAWDGGFTAPSTAVKVPLRAGQAKKGINITLPVGGGISGRVTVSATTDPAALDVVVFDAGTGRDVTSTSTNAADGSYTISGLNPGHYIVCFDGRQETFGSTPYGSQPQCFDGVTWSGHR